MQTLKVIEKGPASALAAFLLNNPDDEWKRAGRVAPDQTEKRRNQLIEGITNAIAQIKAGEDNPKRGWYKTKADKRRVTLKAGRAILPVAGREYNVVNAGDAQRFYETALKLAREGKFDDLLRDPGTAAASAPTTGRKRAGWSPERRAAFEAKRRKAK